MSAQNKTALITGASSGLGVDFARKLAGMGYDLIIAARRLDRLEILATEIEKEFSVKVRVIASDLSKPGAAANLAALIGAVQIDFLVNNSGFGYIGALAEESLDDVGDQIAVNITALTQLTRIYLPGMLARNSGSIINIASTAAYQPIPNMAVYGATKAYVLSFTEALWGEVQGTGVQVLALSPGGTATEFFEVAGGRLAGGKLASPQKVIDIAFAALGARKSSVIVGALNAVTANAVRFVPRKLVIAMAKKVMRPNR